MHKEITFDRFVRGLIVIAGVIAAFLIIDYLRAVLLPFVLAWFLAYLLHPLVLGLEKYTHIHVRAVSILVVMILFIAILSLIGYLIIPPMVEQFQHLSVYAQHYLSKGGIGVLPKNINSWLTDNRDQIMNIFSSEDFFSTLKDVAPKMYSLVGQTWSVIISIIESAITLLYMFFILLDYEYLTKNWIRIFPMKYRPFWKLLANDVEKALNSYIRGQGLVALTMAILFCIGLTIIDFPMAIGLAVLIGILDMVPYLHTLALVPAFFLSLFKAAETGQNFWVIFGSVFAVFCIVQIIIESIVNPKIMGKVMGLNPAILLLSLSIWGTLLGIIGLIIALPATTLCMAYWRRYVTHEETSHLKKMKDDEDVKLS